MIKTSMTTTLCAGVTFMTAVAAAAIAYALRFDVSLALGSAVLVAFIGAAIISLAGNHAQE